MVRIRFEITGVNVGGVKIATILLHVQLFPPRTRKSIDPILNHNRVLVIQKLEKNLTIIIFKKIPLWLPLVCIYQPICWILSSCDLGRGGIWAEKRVGKRGTVGCGWLWVWSGRTIEVLCEGCLSMVWTLTSSPSVTASCSKHGKRNIFSSLFK